jgi:hypothetical protein
MDEPITYECAKCGKSYVKSAKGKGHSVPLYCCGENMIKIQKKKTPKKNTSKITKRK